MQNILYDISLIIIVAVAVAFIARLLKQPFIPAYIIAGLIIGPILSLVTNISVITTLSQLGIAFLLFVVGMEMDLKNLKKVGLVASLGGLVQVILLFAAGFYVAILLSFKTIEAVYLGLIVAFSSTMVVIKLLADKGELDTLHGRIIIGFLLLQDIVAIFALSTLATIGLAMNISGDLYLALGIAFLKGILVLLLAFFGASLIFPSFFKFAAKNSELLFMSALGVCFLFIVLFNLIGFSIAIGAFIAGLTIGNLPYNIEISSRVKPLRDFFGAIFFVSLGMELTVNNVDLIIVPLLIFGLIVLLFKPLVISIICRLFGYKRKTSFLTGLSLAQVSEFSLILVAQGLLSGHIGNNIFSVTVLLAMTTLITTTYFTKYDRQIYSIFRGQGNEGKDLFYMPKNLKYDVILCGYNRIGWSVLRALQKLGKKFLVVDFNPSIIEDLIRQKIPCLYGDIGDIEVLEKLNLDKAKLVISTVPDLADNLLLVRKFKQVNKKGVIFVTASQVDEALLLYKEEADYVILPHFLGGAYVSLLIKQSNNKDKMLKTKLKHLAELRERQRIGHEHPRHKE